MEEDELFEPFRRVEPEVPAPAVATPAAPAPDYLAQANAILGTLDEVVPPALDQEQLIADREQAAAAAEAKREAAEPSFGESMDYAVANDTAIGFVLRQMDRPARDPSWKKSKEQAEAELAMGLTNFPRIKSRVDAAHSQEDYNNLIGEARYRMDFERRAAQTNGTEFATMMAGSMLGAMADPIAAAASFGTVAGLNTIKVGGIALGASRFGRVAAEVGEGAITGAAVGVLAESDSADIDPRSVVNMAITGAIMTVPFSGMSFKRGADHYLAARDFDRLQERLATEIDNGADTAVVAKLRENLDAARIRVLDIARKENDEDLAAAWAAAGPGATSRDVAEAVTALRRRRAEEYSGSDPTEPAPVGTARPIRELTQPTDDLPTVEVAGMRLSREASAVRDFAYNVWDETVDPALVQMQKNMQDWYNLRRSKGGVLDDATRDWLDSPSLIVQQSNSKVARFLGAHLFESASGLGKREQTAALNYEIINSRLVDGYIPELKDALTEALRAAGGPEVIRHALGGARKVEADFWKAVQRERIAHRAAKANKQKHNSSAPKHVQKAGHILDQFWGEASEHLIKHGVKEGEGIKGGGAVGHLPYAFDSAAITRALREDPEAFSALQSLIQAEFRAKTVGRLIDKLNDLGPEKMRLREEELKGRIEELQKEIGDNPATKAVDTARDLARDAEAVTKELNAVRRQMVKVRKELQAELKAIKKAEKEGVVDEVADDSGLPPDEELFNLDGTEDDINDDLFGDISEMSAELMDEFREQLGVVDVGWRLKPQIEDFRGNRDYTEFRAGDILAQIEANTRLDQGERLMLRALQNDIGERGSQLPVFVSNKPGRSFAARDGFIVLDNVLDTGSLKLSEARVALHELAHTRTQQWVGLVEKAVSRRDGVPVQDWSGATYIDPDGPLPAGVTTTMARAWNQLEQVRETLMEKHGEVVGQNFGLGYALRNNHELISMVFNDGRVRDALAGIEVDGMPLLRRVWEAVAAFFANHYGTQGRTTGLDAVIGALDDLSANQATIRTTKGAEFDLAPRSRAEVEAQIEEINAGLKDLDDRLKAAREVRDPVKAAAKATNATSGAKDLRAKRLQLSNLTAQLADMQRDPIGWWAGQLKQIETAANAKADALTSSYLQQVIKDPESRARGASLHITRLAEDLLRENWGGLGITEDIIEDFGKLLRERVADRTRTEFDLSQTKALSDGREVSILDYLHTDGLAMTKTASHDVAGKLSLARMGIRDDIDIEAALDAARTDGATTKELETLRFGFDFLTGKAKSSDNAAIHALRNATFFTRMGKLGTSMLADVPQVAATLGGLNAAKFFMSTIRQMGLNEDLKFKGEPTEFARQLGEVAPGALGRDARWFTMVPDDPTSGAADLQGASLLQRASSRGAQLTSYISGANTVHQATHRAILPMLAAEVVKAVNGKSAISDARLADMGIDQKLIARLKREMGKHDADWNDTKALNWDKWDDQDAADALILSIHRGVFQVLQRSLLGEKQQWMVDSPIGRLIGQFRSYGLTAAEKQFGRNVLGHRDGNTAVASVMGITWASLLAYARVAHAASTKEDPDAYLQEQLEPANFARLVLTMWGMSGLAADFVNVGQALFGGQQYGGFAPAAVLGTAGDIVGAPGTALDLLDGGEEGAKAASKLVKLLPGGNSLPVMSLMGAMLND